MKDTKEIVLFFDENTSFSPLEIAKELLSRYPELGEPIVLPESRNQGSPLVIFNTNVEIQMQVSSRSLNCVINHNYFNKISSIVFDLVDAFDTYGVNFVRIGYISNIFLAPKCVKIAKEKYLRLENLEDIEDVNLGWYRKIKCKYGDLNCWERIVTDKGEFEDLLMQFDINSPRTTKVSFDIKYIKEFIKTAEDFIEERTQF